MSSLRSRLAALGCGTGARAAGPAAPGASLRERLARLRPGAAARASAPAGAPRRTRCLAEDLGGRWLAEGVLLVETSVPLTERHGGCTLTDWLRWAPQSEGLWGGSPGRLLFLDTETTGLAGGTGTLVFLCGLARLGAEDLQIHQYLLAGPAAEPRFLAALEGELGGAETLVTYNGLGFDRPLLSTRFRLNGRGDPTTSQAHLDLLSAVRRAFRTRWPDCRLVTAERRLLGLHRVDDLSGAEAPGAWLAFLRQGDGSRLPAVLRHNRWDLLSLAALLPRLREVYRQPESHGASVLAIARFLAARGESHRAYALLARNRSTLEAAGQLLLARLARQRGDQATAVRLWTNLADQGVPAGIDALAKYHEHVCKDPGAAAELARHLPAGVAAHRRLQRLERKMAHAGGAGMMLGEGDVD